MKKLTKMVSLIALLSSSFVMASDPLDLDKFEFPAPAASDLGKTYKLWATYYYLPEIQEDSGNIPLRDMKGQELGPRLTLRHWCDTAMEGSVKINYNNGDVKTFNYQGVTNDFFVDCKSIFPRHPAIGKTKFREANGVYGDGLDDYILSPYRTLATDITFIKPGTAIYIPKARGAKIKTRSGREIIHDGYFFAADKGGAIKGSHVDVYIGVSKSASFFPWIGSSETKTFEAFVVKDQKIIDELLQLHSQK
jgi:3D (Asp-Asp-Asp) domain-containing protein